uniref:Microfibril-associated glycoprotein 4-like n=1 Tax=Sphaeramia orbicularis TaxID=375764 RepID=A0A673CC57_9TELE
VRLVLFVLLSPLLACDKKELVQPTDCSEISKHDSNKDSGVYVIYPLGERSAVQVYCDMKAHGGRWTVIQTRMDGTLNFYRNYDQYKLGFGDANGEYWIGLDNIHYLTRRQKYELAVDLEDFNGKKVSAHYASFSVGSECTGYKLTVTGFVNGGAGDSLGYSNGARFSTFDRDQDTTSSNCARALVGAHWYKSCSHSNPNGVYRWGNDKTVGAIGVFWYHWNGYYYSVKSISMKIRPVM